MIVPRYTLIAGISALALASMSQISKADPTYNFSESYCSPYSAEAGNRVLTVKLHISPDDAGLLSESSKAVAFLMPIIGKVIDYCESQPKDASYQSHPRSAARTVRFSGDRFSAEWDIIGKNWLNSHNEYREKRDADNRQAAQKIAEEQSFKRQKEIEADNFERQRQMQEDAFRRQRQIDADNAQRQRQLEADNNARQQAQFQARNDAVASAQARFDRIKHDRSLQERRFGHAIDSIVTLDEIVANPYAYKNKVVVVRATFNRMDDENTASFNTIISPIHTTNTPSNQFVVPQQNVWLAMRVKDLQAPVEIETNNFFLNILSHPDAHIVKAGVVGEYVGSYVCKTQQCLDVGDE